MQDGENSMCIEIFGEAKNMRNFLGTCSVNRGINRGIRRSFERCLDIFLILYFLFVFKKLFSLYF